MVCVGQVLIPKSVYKPQKPVNPVPIRAIDNINAIIWSNPVSQKSVKANKVNPMEIRIARSNRPSFGLIMDIF